MFDHDHRWCIGLDHFLQLYPGDDISKIKWLIPDIEVGLFAKAFGDEDLFLLASGIVCHILSKVAAGKIQFTQHSFKKRFVQMILGDKRIERPLEE